MLYTQQISIPSSGVLRIGTIGGEPYEWIPDENKNLQQTQVGYMLPVRVGVLKVKGFTDAIFDCVANVSGYSDRPISNVRLPGSIIVELPCGVTITGPAGTQVIVEAWKVDSIGNERGASRSAVVGVGIPIPIWAESFDIFQSGVATFVDSSAATVAVITGPAIGASIPSGAVAVNLVGDANTPIIFRQQ